MIKKILALTAVFSLVSCESSTPGTLVIDQTFKVNATVKGGGSFGDPNGTHIEVKNLNAGTYKSTLTVKSRNELFLSVGGNSNLDLSIHIPDGQPIPEDSGDFAITASQSRQPFDLAGAVASTKTDTELRRGWENCYVTRHEQVCQYIPNSGYVCHDQLVQYPGQKDVEYFDRKIVKNVEVNLFNPGTQEKLGHFSGTSTDTERHYTYEGFCR